jgi:hypothetical protein
MVNNEKGLEGTALKANVQIGMDKFLAIYPKVDWTIQLQYAEEIGLGSRVYELVEI